MELLIGVFIGFFIQSIIKAGWRMLNPPRPAPTQPPKTPAQLANEAAYEAVQVHHPRIVSTRVTRRVPRGARRARMERENERFEE